MEFIIRRTALCRCAGSGSRDGISVQREKLCLSLGRGLKSASSSPTETVKTTESAIRKYFEDSPGKDHVQVKTAKNFANLVAKCLLWATNSFRLTK